MAEADPRWPEQDYPHQELTQKIIGAAVKVHRALGPGFVEAVYENALVHELGQMGLKVRRQVAVPVVYAGVPVGGHRIDVLVEEQVVVELKAVGELLPIHQAQARSTLKAAGLQIALLMNFNVAKLTDGGVKRVIAAGRSPLGPSVPLC